MKICLHTTHTISQNYIGGTERFLITLAKELQLLGVDPFIVCSSLVPETIVEGVKVIGRVPIQFQKVALAYKRLNYEFLKSEVLKGTHEPYEMANRLSLYVEEQIKDISADVYHFNSFLSASLITKKLNYIVTNHENDKEMNYFWGDDFFEKFSILVRSKQLNIQTAKGLYAPSEYYSKIYSDAFNLPVTPIKLGVLLNDFEINKNDNKTVLKQEKGLENELVILLPSRLNVIQKGHDIALKACQILKNNNINFKLLITGLGKSSQNDILKFRNEIRKYQLENRVVLSSYGNMLNAYNICDIVISPERYCSYGLSISESLSMGIDTILSDIPTYKEIAKKYTHAYFFKSEDYESLANNIMQ